MRLSDVQKHIVDAINADEMLVAAGCRACIEDKGDAFAEVNAALEGVGICALVGVPSWKPESNAAKNAVGRTSFTVNVIEVPPVNRERPGYMTGLNAAERIAWALNLTKPDGPGGDVLALDPAGISSTIAEDGTGAIYHVPFVCMHQLKG